MKNFSIVFFALILTGMLYVQKGPLCAGSYLTLDNIKVTGNKIELHTSGQAKYNIFKISNPPRLVIEIFNVEQNLKQKEINVQGQIIKRVRGSQFQNEPTKITRIVVELTKQSEYSASQQGENISVLLSTTPEKQVQSAKNAKTPAVSISTAEKKIVKPAAVAKSTAVISAAGAAKVPVLPPKKPKLLPKPATAPYVSTAVVHKEIVVSTPVIKTAAAQIDTRKAVPRRLRSGAAAQPQLSQQPPKPPVTKTPAPVYKPAPVQAAKQTVSKVAKKEKRSELRIIGKISLPKTPVTMEYQDADIVDVLQVLSMRSGINIIAGTDVAGTISISLKDVPFDQAFNTILTIKGLSAIAVGDNILQVITPQALTTQRQQEIVFTKIYPLNYAEAPVISAQIKNVFASEGLKGDVNTDDRTNSLIVSASNEGHSAVERVLKELDIKPQQVMIESRVVDVNISDTNELGVSWSMDNIAAAAGAGVTSGARSQSITPGDSPAVSISQSGQTGSQITVSGAQSAMAVPSQGGLSFNFGYITNSNILTTKLGILANEGRVKLLSNPKVSTVNNKQAKIMVGEKIPYKTTTIGAGGVSQENYQFLSAGIELTVTPTVSPDKWITLKVRPVVSVPIPAPAGTAPTVKTRETDVTVMVKDGDTIVIGGLISDSDIEQMEKIPVLGDIPLFGYLFKHKISQKSRSELLIFITPRILEE